MKILMVCLGNICRSPLAEGIMKQKIKEAGLDWIVDSAGTNGFHTGEAPHHLSQKVARIHGIDISMQVARRFKAEDLYRFDRIYAMANDVLMDIKKITGPAMDENKTILFLEELYTGQNCDVPDPWYGDENCYHEVYDLINETCDAILKNIPVTNQQTQ